MDTDVGYRWKVCEPITGDVVADVALDPTTARISSRGENPEAVEAARDAVQRFADQALGITVGD